MKRIMQEAVKETKNLMDYNLFYFTAIFPVFILLDVLIFTPIIKWVAQMDFSIASVYLYTFYFAIVFLILLFLLVFLAGLASTVINRLIDSGKEAA